MLLQITFQKNTKNYLKKFIYQTYKQNFQLIKKLKTH